MHIYNHYHQGFNALKIKLWLSLLLGTSHGFVFSQAIIIDGIVLNSTNNISIPFTTIANITTGKFTLSDSTGKFSLPASIGDSLTISHIAYQDTLIIIEPHQHTFYMSQKKMTLPEVVINGRRLTLSKEHLGYDLSKQYDYLNLQKNYRHAVYIQNRKDAEGFIKYIHFNIYKMGKCHNGVRILIFDVDTTDIKKSIVLLCKPIELPPIKISHKNKVDVSAFSIPFPLTGVIVSIESFDWQESCKPEDMMLLKSTQSITDTVNLIGYGNNKWELMKYPNWTHTPQIGLTIEFKHSQALK